MKFMEEFSHITCACGKKFQVLKETVTEIPDDQGQVATVVTLDWDEAETAKRYYKHLDSCES